MQCREKQIEVAINSLEFSFWNLNLLRLFQPVILLKFLYCVVTERLHPSNFLFVIAVLILKNRVKFDCIQSKDKLLIAQLARRKAKLCFNLDEWVTEWSSDESLGFDSADSKYLTCRWR